MSFHSVRAHPPHIFWSMHIHTSTSLPNHAGTGHLKFTNTLINFLMFHCPELRDIQWEAIKSYRELNDTFVHDRFDLNDSSEKTGSSKDNPYQFLLDISNQTWEQEIEDGSRTIRTGNNALDDIMKPGIVHRLDKKTSGLLVVCKHKGVMSDMMFQFKDHSIIREYLALVHNTLAKPAMTVRTYMERHEHNRFQSLSLCLSFVCLRFVYIQLKAFLGCMEGFHHRTSQDLPFILGKH